MSGDNFSFDFGEKPRDPKAPLFDSEEMKGECIAILAEARLNRTTLTWDEAELRYRRALFPNVAHWITDEEVRKQLCFEFAEECAHIEQLLLAA